MGIALNLQITFVKMAIVTVLILQNHELSMGNLSSEVFFDFFLQRDLKFCSYRFFTCLVRVTPRYFILFVTNVKDVVSLISFSVPSSFEQRKSTDLSELILHPATLLNLFISCRSSLVEFLGRLYISYDLQIVMYLDFLPSNLCPLDLFLLSNCSGQNFKYYIKQIGRESAALSCT